MDEVRVRVLSPLRHRLIGFATQEGHPEASSCIGEEAKSGKGRTWDTPSISNAVFRNVGNGSSRLYAYRASAGC